jgi:hypothetical protein
MFVTRVCGMQRLINSHYIIYSLTAIASILLSIWINTHAVLLNPDAICYLQTAETIHDQGLSAAMSLCGQSKWPFYSLLIAGIAKFTTLSYEHSAIILNSLFSVLTVLIFIRIVSLFSHKKSILWFAALVVLLFHDWNGVKSDIIRDHGFVFFYLLSIFSLLQYVQHKQWSNAIMWSSSIILATLFRVEGIIFLLIMPFFVLFERQQTYKVRLKDFLYLNSLLIIASIALVSIVAVYPELSLGRLSQLSTHLHFAELRTTLIRPYVIAADWIGHVLFTRDVQDRYLIYFFILLVWYLSVIITALSLIYTVLTLFAWQKKLLPPLKNARLVLWGYVALNVLITFVFLIENQFISKRYMLALAFTLMLWIPFSLEYLLNQWRQKKWPLVLSLFFIGLYGMSGIFHFADSKQYIREAGDWLNTHAPHNALIYSNDYQILYYSHHFANNIFVEQHRFADLHILQDGKWKQYDYLALRLNEKTLPEATIVMNEIHASPIIVFTNKHNKDQVRIYQKVQS